MLGQLLHGLVKEPRHEEFQDLFAARRKLLKRARGNTKPLIEDPQHAFNIEIP